jgi:hypothetical protein
VTLIIILFESNSPEVFPGDEFPVGFVWRDTDQFLIQAIGEESDGR